MSLDDRLMRWAAQRPDHLAFAVDDDRLTYGELLSSAASLARAIRARRTTTTTRFGRQWREPLVAINLPNSPAFVRAFTAATIAGAAVAVLDPAWPPALAQAAMELLRPDSLITDDADVARRGLACSEYTSWLQPAADTTAGHVDWLRPDPASRFLVGFTSGTTSMPKAFLRSRRSWWDSLAHSETLFAAREDSVTLAPGPLAHGLSLYALVESLFSGGTFVALTRFDTDLVATAARRHLPTRFVGVPTMYQRLLASPTGAAALRTVRTFVSSGAKMPRPALTELFAVAPESTFLEYYGASELSFVSVSRTTAAAAGSTAPTDVGTPFPGVEVQVRDDAGSAVPDGCAGTVYVRSTLVSDGYLTEERSGFRRAGQWCTVGDRGFVRNRRLHILGREGDMVLVGGNNIYPAEVEAALRSFRPLIDAYVIAVDDPVHGARLIAVVSAADADVIDVAGLRTHLTDRLPKYKLPRALVAVTDWPMTNSGKVNKAALAAAYLTAAPDVRELPWS